MATGSGFIWKKVAAFCLKTTVRESGEAGPLLCGGITVFALSKQCFATAGFMFDPVVNCVFAIGFEGGFISEGFRPG
jgi:hypothetical protein